MQRPCHLPWLPRYRCLWSSGHAGRLGESVYDCSGLGVCRAARRVIDRYRCLSGGGHAGRLGERVCDCCSLAVCRLLLDAGLEPVWQLACRDRNRIALQADLLGANALGIRNLLCLTGDPVRAGDQADARPVNEFESVKLLQQVSALNRGEDPVKGALSDGATTLFQGCAADPHSRSWSGLQRRLTRKCEAGARFVQTQMVMDPAVLERFQNELAKPLELPVLAGVFLLKSAKNALFINRMVPGACIPDDLIQRLDQATDPAQEGIAIAAEQVKRYSGLVQGVHLMAIKAEERIPQILDRAGVSLPLG